MAKLNQINASLSKVKRKTGSTRSVISVSHAVSVKLAQRQKKSKANQALRAIVHASLLYTGEGIQKKQGRRPLQTDLGVIKDGAMVYSVHKVNSVLVPHKIVWVGSTPELPRHFKIKKGHKTDLKNKYALMPGLIDCHTHLIFAGDRAAEFASRCAGVSYEQIAQQGGGIVSTVRATRQASVRELESLAIKRLSELDRYGVRTVEIKSGYGLSMESELKILSIIPRLRRKFPHMTLTSTFLGAHAYPPEIKSGPKGDPARKRYFKEVVETQLPEVVRRKLADACDIFIDRGYFNLEQARQLMTQAKKLGLNIKVHADELVNTESAALAAELGALSADHLLRISDRGIEALSKSDTVAVLLPGTAFYLKESQAPARRLIESGARVALATDFNPGTSMCLSLPAIMTIAALYLGMSCAEIFAAVTYNAALALGKGETKGTLQEGKDADFYILPFLRFEEMYYRFAWAPEVNG